MHDKNVARIKFARGRHVLNGFIASFRDLIDSGGDPRRRFAVRPRNNPPGPNKHTTLVYRSPELVDDLKVAAEEKRDRKNEKRVTDDARCHFFNPLNKGIKHHQDVDIESEPWMQDLLNQQEEKLRLRAGEPMPYQKALLANLTK